MSRLMYLVAGFTIFAVQIFPWWLVALCGNNQHTKIINKSCSDKESFSLLTIRLWQFTHWNGNTQTRGLL